jgi:hypothetical protein
VSVGGPTRGEGAESLLPAGERDFFPKEPCEILLPDPIGRPLEGNCNIGKAMASQGVGQAEDGGGGGGQGKRRENGREKGRKKEGEIEENSYLCVASPVSICQYQQSRARNQISIEGITAMAFGSTHPSRRGRCWGRGRPRRAWHNTPPEGPLRRG